MWYNNNCSRCFVVFSNFDFAWRIILSFPQHFTIWSFVMLGLPVHTGNEWPNTRSKCWRKKYWSLCLWNYILILRTFYAQWRQIVPCYMRGGQGKREVGDEGREGVRGGRRESVQKFGKSGGREKEENCARAKRALLQGGKREKRGREGRKEGGRGQGEKPTPCPSKMYFRYSQWDTITILGTWSHLFVSKGSCLSIVVQYFLCHKDGSSLRSLLGGTDDKLFQCSQKCPRLLEAIMCFTNMLSKHRLDVSSLYKTFQAPLVRSNIQALHQTICWASPTPGDIWHCLT